jgi:hypothetical protein
VQEEEEHFPQESFEFFFLALVFEDLAGVYCFLETACGEWSCPKTKNRKETHSPFVTSAISTSASTVFVADTRLGTLPGDAVRIIAAAKRVVVHTDAGHHNVPHRYECKISDQVQTNTSVQVPTVSQESSPCNQPQQAQFQFVCR